MRASLSITAHADLCADLLPEDEDGVIQTGGPQVDAAWDWLVSRATLQGDDSVLVELPPHELLQDHMTGNISGRDEIEQRFMATWAPPADLRIELEQLIRAGVSELVVHRDVEKAF